MKKIIVGLTAMFLLLLYSSCRKAKSDYNDYLPKLKTISATVQTDGSVLVKGELVSDGEAPVWYVGFCCSTKNPPEMTERQIICSNTFSAIYPNLNADSSYHFRAWATNKYGYSYSNTITLDSIIAPLVTAPCSLAMNTVSKDGSFTSSIYSVSHPVYDFNSGYTVDVSANGLSFTLLFGSPVANGIFTTYAGPDTHPPFRQVYIKLNYPYALNAGTNVYVNTISPGIFDVTICEAPWVAGSNTLHFNSRFTIP